MTNYISIFGSVSRGEDKPKSEVDVLYQFKKGSLPMKNTSPSMNSLKRSSAATWDNLNWFHRTCHPTGHWIRHESLPSWGNRIKTKTVFITHTKTRCECIMKVTAETTYEKFCSDPDLQDIMIHSFLTTGEAVIPFSEEFVHHIQKLCGKNRVLSEMFWHTSISGWIYEKSGIRHATKFRHFTLRSFHWQKNKQNKILKTVPSYFYEADFLFYQSVTDDQITIYY